MNTVIAIACIVGVLVIAPLTAFFMSDAFLRSSLLDRKTDLEKLPSDEDVSTLIAEIKPYIPKEETKDEKPSVDDANATQESDSQEHNEKPSEDIPLKNGKIAMVKLLWKSSRLLSRKVPCYLDYGRRIPEYHERVAENSFCHRCTVSNCAFRE